MQIAQRRSNLLAQNAVTHSDTTNEPEIQRHLRAPTMKQG
jgi:hypothetical protein